jgi:putative oxidoreductase
MIVRRLARPLIAAIFISGGVDTLRDPKPRVQAVEPFLRKSVDAIGSSLPSGVPTDPATLVKLDAAVKVGAGLTLALGKFPRLSAVALALGLVPTSLAAHAFWEHEDPQARAMHQTHFLKNLGLLGGLLFVATDRKPAAKPKAEQKSDKKAARKAAKKAELKAARKADR